MDSTNQTQPALEGSLKATLVQLSHILAFQARLQQQGAAQYAHQAPKQLTDQLRVEADKFEGVCQAIEQRVLKAIAILERDARKAAGISPLSVPSPAPAPDPEAAPAPPKPAVETITIDDEPLPFSLPVSTAAAADATTSTSNTTSGPIQLDLTLSPSPPPPAAAATTLPENAPLPFQLPVSTSSSSTPSAPPPAPAQAPADDDINALLSSLNMPPFDPSAFLSASLTSAAPPASSTAPDLTLDQLTALFPPSSAPSFTSAPAPIPPFSAPLDLSSLGLTTSSSSSSAPAAPPDPVPGVFDYASFLNPIPDASAALGGGVPGLGDLDLSSLGAGEFDFSQVATGGGVGGVGGVGGGGQPDLDELLKSLG